MTPTRRTGCALTLFAPVLILAVLVGGAPGLALSALFVTLIILATINPT